MNVCSLATVCLAQTLMVAVACGLLAQASVNSFVIIKQREARQIMVGVLAQLIYFCETVQDGQ